MLNLSAQHQGALGPVAKDEAILSAITSRAGCPIPPCQRLKTAIKNVAKSWG